MKQVHVECLPDEHLVKSLGFSRKYITHHQGKARVFNSIKSKKDQLAMVDEDPRSVKTSYEKSLQFVEESNGLKLYQDKSGNKIVFLQIKLEDWIISSCQAAKIKMGKFGLPEDPDDLHDVINARLPSLDKLLSHVAKSKNKAFSKLKAFLN
jgi:hypothetical protein